MFDETSMLRPNSQYEESMKTKEVSKRLEDDTTPCSLVSSVLFGISPDMISGGNHVVDLDAEHVE